MTIEQYSQLTYDFLMMHNIVDKLLEYTQYRTYQNPESELRYSILCYAFEWAKSFEGRSYWNHIEEQTPTILLKSSFTLREVLEGIKNIHYAKQTYEYW